MAIFTQNIDAFSFTFLRIISAMVILLFIYFYKNKKIKIDFKNNYISGFMFFLYAICFSYSYINMAAGIGTLILFAVVQLTMIILALFLNEKLTLKKIIGITIAFGGLVYLLYPKDDFTISYFHAFLMFLSAIGWAIFSVLGKKSNNATLNATDSFVKAFIFTILFAIFYLFFFENSLKIDFLYFYFGNYFRFNNNCFWGIYLVFNFTKNADYDGKYNSVNSANNSYYFKYCFS